MTKRSPFALRGDRPIESAEQDRLGRSPFAKAIAAQVLESPALDSFAVAIMGPWGCGKTSLVNMITEELRHRSDSVVVDFNPWMFSGTEQLVGFFFRELGAQVAELSTKKRFAAAGAALQKYGGLLGHVAEVLPVVGGAAKKGLDLAKEAGGAWAEAPSIESQRTKIREQLLRLDKRIVVVVDDIDRLRPEEVRELLKLVRVTGDFPGIVYVLAFDRVRVERALGDDVETGRAYLEKLVQVGFDVPLPMDADIAQMLIEELNAVIDGVDHRPIDSTELLNIFQYVIRPLFRSPRDVRRYANALPPILRVTGREVALEDVLALEALRVFLPDVFAALPALARAITDDGYAFSNSRVQYELCATRLKCLAADAGPLGEVVTQFFQRLFPAAAHYFGGPHYGEGFVKEWRRKRRVASIDVLRYYLERRLPEGVIATAEVEAALAVLGDRDALREFVARLTPDQVEHLLGRLEAFEDEFPSSAVESAVGALLDQSGQLRQERRHFFDLGADFALARVVLRLLRRVEADEEREGLLARLIPSLLSLSARQTLLEVVEGHKLATTQAVDAWRAELLASVAAATADQVVGERKLAILLESVIDKGGEPADKARQLLDDDFVFVSVLATAMKESSSWSPGNAASVQQQELQWSALERLMGTGLAERIREVRARVDESRLDARGKSALDLAVRYAEGWRPPNSFQRPKTDNTDDAESAATKAATDEREADE